MQRRFLLGVAVLGVVCLVGLRAVFARERIPGQKSSTTQAAEAAKAREEQRTLDEETWKAIEPQLADWAKKGKPYIPQASKPSDLPQADIPAFPGAEGGGAHSFGGRGGKVFVVTSLADSGPGTLREACDAVGPRIVVFDAAGIIHLKSPLRIRAPYITIAGQTAPGDGVCVAGESTLIDTHDVVIRYMRFRRGEIDANRRDDALGGDPVGNVIVDHVSASWGLDENLSIYRHMYEPPEGGRELKLPTVNVTLQWCISSEALDIYDHAFGGTWGGRNTSFHHNLFACNTGRNPSIGMGYDFNFVNNVLYNWRHRTVDGGDETSLYNVINNYYKPGPACGNGGIRYRVFKPQSLEIGGPRGEPNLNAFGKAYIVGNIMVGNEKVTADNWDGGVQFDKPPMWYVGLEDTTQPSLDQIRVDKPFLMAPVTIDSAGKAYERVLAHAGATRPKRDPVDIRILQEVRTGTVTFEAGKGIIQQVSDVGGYPQYQGQPVVDSDGDGMPDEWETKYGLNPHDASDAVKDCNGDGYTNIEKYLNGIDPTKRLDYKDPKNNVNLLEPSDSQ